MDVVQDHLWIFSHITILSNFLFVLTVKLGAKTIVLVQDMNPRRIVWVQVPNDYYVTALNAECKDKIN